MAGRPDVASSETIFRGIEQGTRTYGDRNLQRSSLNAIWDIDSQQSIRYDNDREYVTHFRQLYAQAMQARLRGLDHVGVLLSGGLDSSSVVAMAARLNPGGRPVAVHTYNLAFDGLPDGDDRQPAETVARFCDVPFFCLPAQGTAALFYVELARALEDTIPSPIGSGRLMLARRAFSEGCGVLLDGTGGDEWFGGAHQHTADLLRNGRLIAAVRQLRADADSDLGHGIGTLTASSVWALLPNAVRTGIKHVLPPRDRVPRGFNRVFAQQVAVVDRITTSLTDRRFASIATGTAYMTATHPYCSYAWEEIARQDAIAGVELGAPLMDRRLAEFAMALPEEQRWAGSSTKRVLRDAMDGWLPDSTRRRYKADAGSAQVCELRRLYADGAFKAMELVEDGVLDGTAVNAMYEEMIEKAANGDRGYKMLADQLWTIFLGECTWQSLFGRRATPLASSSEFGCELLSD